MRGIQRTAYHSSLIKLLNLKVLSGSVLTFHWACAVEGLCRAAVKTACWDTTDTQQLQTTPTQGIKSLIWNQQSASDRKKQLTDPFNWHNNQIKTVSLFTHYPESVHFWVCIKTGRQQCPKCSFNHAWEWIYSIYVYI